MKEVAETDGTFAKPKSSDRPCPKCGEQKVTYETWESSCGGYDDYKFTCECGHFWWVDGGDS